MTKTKKLADVGNLLDGMQVEVRYGNRDDSVVLFVRGLLRITSRMADNGNTHYDVFPTKEAFYGSHSRTASFDLNHVKSVHVPAREYREAGATVRIDL